MIIFFFSFSNLNLSPIFGSPPTIQKIFLLLFKANLLASKLVALESFIKTLLFYRLSSFINDRFFYKLLKNTECYNAHLITCENLINSFEEILHKAKNHTEKMVENLNLYYCQYMIVFLHIKTRTEF